MNRAVFVVVCLLGAGCATQGPAPKQPPPDIPARWSGEGTETPVTQEPWWRGFHDPTLAALLGEALRVNNDLAASATRVYRARLLARLQSGRGYPNTVPPVAAGLPTDVLARRPDVQAAERRLQAALANVDVTRTSFYPQITLTGELGSTGPSLINMLQNPVATLGAGVLLPFIEWNTMRLNIKVSEAEYEEAVI